jgi:hypothetical protein
MNKNKVNPQGRLDMARTDRYTGAESYQIFVNGEWPVVAQSVWRSWAGRRKHRGIEYHGIVYVLDADRVDSTSSRACLCSTCSGYLYPPGVTVQYRTGETWLIGHSMGCHDPGDRPPAVRVVTGNQERIDITDREKIRRWYPTE